MKKTFSTEYHWLSSQYYYLYKLYKITIDVSNELCHWLFVHVFRTRVRVMTTEARAYSSDDCGSVCAAARVMHVWKHLLALLRWRYATGRHGTTCTSQWLGQINFVEWLMCACLCQQWAMVSIVKHFTLEWIPREMQRGVRMANTDVLMRLTTCVCVYMRTTNVFIIFCIIKSKYIELVRRNNGTMFWW